MTTAVQTYDSPDAVRKDLDGLRQQVADVLPNHIDPDRFLRVVAKAVIGNPRVMECTRVSLLSAVHEAAQLGLEPSGLLGSAYIVPYRRNGKLQAQLIVGYRGLIGLARRSGEIQAIWAKVVRQRDVFRIVEGSNPHIVHEQFVPDPSDEPEDRDPGPFLGAYMIAKLRGMAEPQQEWMTYDQIEQVRTRSRAADDGPWVTDWSEMARKTVVRRGSKYLPLSTEFGRALELDEEAERDAEPIPVSRPSRAQQMLLDRAGASRSHGEPMEVADTSTDPVEPSEAVLEAEPEGVVAEGFDKNGAYALCGAVVDDATCGLPKGHAGKHRGEPME